MKRVLLLLGGIVAAAFARGDYATLEIAQSEAIADYIRFESRSWAEDATGDGGRLQTNAVWTGEHVIWSDLYIPSGVTLTMNLGTVVRFCEGTRIKVENGGRLIITGEAGNEVVLKGYEDATKFTGIVLQSSAATYSDNSQVIIKGFTFGEYAVISISDTSAFTGDGQALVPVTLSGSRDTAFSFDWVAETNGVAFARGTMKWNNVSEGTKNIVVSFSDGLPGCETFTVRAECLRCCTASKGTALVKLSGYLISDIAITEAMADYIPFESDEWNLAQGGDCGRLTANAVWEGEHVITSDLYIPAGVTLTLTANTVVKFAEGTRIKIEDGGTLNIIGAQGNDVVLRGVDSETKFGGIVKMTNGTFTDNSFVQVAGFVFSAFADIALNNSETFRSSGLALIPVTVSGSRTTTFSIDWVAETNGVPYKTGTLSWGTVNDGTRNININFGHELDGCAEFDVRVAVNRACSSSPSSCKVKIRDFNEADVVVAEAMADYIPFESREWAEGMRGEGGRLSANTVWEGAHTIVSDVYIPAGVTLTLVAGADIAFCEGTRIKIEDGGALNIVGESGNDVIFHAAEGVRSFVGIVKMTNGTYTDNMYVQCKDTPYSNYPFVTIHESSTYRDKGKVYIPLTLSGSTRDQSFNVDWETDKGDSGTITWNSSSDGTKLIEVPIDATLTGGTVKHKVTLTAARGCNVATSEAEIVIYEFDYSVTENVSLTEDTTASEEFAVNGEIKMQPVFLNESEPIAFSGRWQNKVPPEDTIVRLSVESDNGVERLATYDGSETGDYTWKASDYRVGHYTLRHEIVEKSSGGVLDAVTKSFSIVDEDDVVMHGGTLTQNETWKAGKTHVVYETVYVPSIYTLFIEPGAIVKFMTGTGIDIAQGGALFANAIIFTHIDDDTIGGDTLSDGYTVAPVMDSYTLNGAFTFGVDTELRYITQSAAIEGTINDQRVLSRGSTYKVSGTVTIANGASLTIPSGTILKMEAGAQITVAAGGTLNAIGTRSAPIVITSIKDDEYGGDTDGVAALPAGGDWKYIYVQGTANLEYCTVLYGAPSNETGILETNGSGILNLKCCVIAHAKYDGIWNWGGTINGENCVITDVGVGVSAYQGKSTYRNCVIHGVDYPYWFDYLTMQNCIFSECGLGFLDTRWRNGNEKISNTIYWNPEEYGPQEGKWVGKNGNAWGDPLFVDPDNGDFRVKEGSPCIDAADGTAAPELDYYGQPRLTLLPDGQTEGVPDQYGEYPDIGVCEVMPRNVTSDIDLTAKSVRADAEAVAGQLVFIKWEVANIGGAYVNDSWRDTISLVSENGQEIVLGDKMTKSAISVGGSAFCSAYFTLPAIAEGVWYPKVNVNNFHDIFEGTLYDNNVLVGETGINVSISKVESEGKDGVINGGVPTVLKFALDETGGNRMVRLDVPAGVTVSYGFGFVPSGANASGKIVSSGSEVLFKVPDGMTDVYVSLESDKTVEYAMTFEDGNVQIVSVSPNSLPASGSVRVMITGAGFDESASVEFVNGDASVFPSEVKYEDANTLVATVDCGELVGGRVYGIKVAGDVGTATMEDAISVAKVEGKGILALSYDIPESVRAGRVFTFTITCKNVGTADLCCPLIAVEDTGTDNANPISFSLDGQKFTDGFLQFVSKDARGGFDGISPGEEYSFKMYAKMPAKHSDTKAVSVRANADSGDNSGDCIEMYRYFMPAHLAGYAASQVETVRRRGEMIKAIFGTTDCEMVRNFAELARKALECNGEPVQDINALLNFGIANYENSIVNVNAFSMQGLDSGALQSTASLDTGAYIRTGRDTFVPLGDSDVDLRDKRVVVIAHGLWDQLERNGWMMRMGDAIAAVTNSKRKVDVVIYVNWEKYSHGLITNIGGNFHYDPYGEMPVSDSIPLVANLVIQQLRAHNFTPGLSTFIGHSFGSHLLGYIAARGFNGAVNRHIGLDTANILAVNDENRVTGRSAQHTEFYKSSPICGRGDAYADENYIVVAKDGFNNSLLSERGKHSYSYDWFIKNVADETSGIGYWANTKIKITPPAGTFFGVIDGDSNRLECIYPYGNSAYDLSAFNYPGCQSSWLEMKDAWSWAVDLQINPIALPEIKQVSSGDFVEFDVSWKDNADDDIATIEQYDSIETRITLIVRDKANKQELVKCSWEKPRVEHSAHLGFVLPHDVVAVSQQRLCEVSVSLTSGYRTPNKSKGVSDGWTTIADLYDADNNSVVDVTVVRGRNPIPNVNEETQQGFVLRKTFFYKTKEDFDEAVASDKSELISLNASKSTSGDGRKIALFAWRGDSNGEIENSKSIWNRKVSATQPKCYPIHLTVMDDNLLSASLSGSLEVSVVIGDNDGKPLSEPKSVDPNEMGGILGRGDEGTQRYVKPGEWMTYTVYFENKSTATAAAQEVRVTNPLSAYLDWSTFEMGEVAFNNQIDLGLSGKQNGTSEVRMNGTSYQVRSTVALDKDDGKVDWYLRIVDPSTPTTWPDDVFAGFLPPNDETFRGEGHLTYRVKVRDDAPVDARITNSATIIFDFNDPIETDPAWWNLVGEFNALKVDIGDDGETTLDLAVNVPFGALPVPKKKGHTFKGWFFGPNGTGGEITAETIVPSGLEHIYAHWEKRVYDIWVDGVNNAKPYGEVATFTTDAAVTNGCTNLVCTGWVGTGDVPAFGTSNAVTFVVSQESSLWWQHATNYWVSAMVDGGGSVTLRDAAGVRLATNELWMAAGTNLVAEAIAAEGQSFSQWTDVETGDKLGGERVLALRVDRPLSVRAEFTNLMYCVKFDLGAHGSRIGGGALTQIVAWGGAALAPTVIPEAGYAFAGWSAAFNRVTQNLVVTAKWTRNGCSFMVKSITVEEGEGVTLIVSGGDVERATSAQVFVTYQTATAADIDLAKGTVDGVMPKGGLKFPLTLAWEAGDTDPKTIVIPVKADKTVEDDETLVFQLAAAQGQELGEPVECRVTVRDATVEADYAAKQAKTTVKTKKGVEDFGLAVSCVADDGSGEVCGYTTGQGSYYSGYKASLKATARPGWEFRGWGEVAGGVTNIVSDKASWSVTLTNEAEFVAVFGRIPYVAGLADPADGGKVSGSGYCATGKKVTLKATANKNFTFVGWYADGKPVSGLATLVIDRSAKPAKPSKTQDVITNISESVTYYATFVSDPEVFVSAVSSDGEGARLTGNGAGKYVAGTITGAGKYVEGKSVTLKATANKGYVFAGWYEDPKCTVPVSGDYLAASYAFVMGGEDSELYAKFIPTEEDAASVKMELPEEFTNGAEIKPVTLDLSGCLSTPTAKVTGLPTGLKFTTKALDVKATKTTLAAHYEANTIYGTPTKSGVYTIIATVTTAGKKTASASAVVVVRKAGEMVVKAEVPDVAGVVPGKITGMGVYAEGKSVTLKATVNKGYVFAGWYEDPKCTVPVSGDYLAASYAFVMGGEDSELYAKFIPTEEDAASVKMELPEEFANGAEIKPVTLDLSGCLSTPTVKVSGLPTGLKFTTKALDVKATKTTLAAHYEANTIYGTPTKSGVYTIVATVTTAGKKTASASAVVVVRKAGERVVKVEVPDVAGVVPGKVTGMGVYAEGKSVTLKATANKGYVFAGWYDGKALLSKEASWSMTMGTADKTFEAKFVTVQEDIDAITLAVDGTPMDSGKTFATNLTCGVAVEWPIESDGLSATTVNVSGLPTGLKLVQDKTTKAYSVIGVPTSASKKDKQGNFQPSAVKFTVTTAGKNSKVFTANVTVQPLPDWVIGTFTEVPYVDEAIGTNGVASVTIAASGKITAKRPVGGKSTSFAANNFDTCDIKANSYWATLTAKVGKEVVTNQMTVCGQVVHMPLPDGGEQTITNCVIRISAMTAAVVISAEVTGGKAIEVEPSWAAQYPAFAAKFGDDLAAALIKKTGKKDANGDEMAVWQDYVAGTDPTDPESQFKASVEFVGGKPVVKWSPDLNEDGAKSLRVYKTFGAKSLGGLWEEVSGNEADYNFFKVTVEMP